MAVLASCLASPTIDLVCTLHRTLIASFSRRHYPTEETSFLRRYRHRHARDWSRGHLPDISCYHQAGCGSSDSMRCNAQSLKWTLGCHLYGESIVKFVSDVIASPRVTCCVMVAVVIVQWPLLSLWGHGSTASGPRVTHRHERRCG